MLKQKLTEAINGNSWLAKYKDKISFFSKDDSGRLKLDRVAVQRALEAKIDRAVKVWNSVEINLSKRELIFLPFKKYKDIVIIAKLKNIQQGNEYGSTNRAKDLR